LIPDLRRDSQVFWEQLHQVTDLILAAHTLPLVDWRRGVYLFAASSKTFEFLLALFTEASIQMGSQPSS
jgi:hypothetical protein